MRVVMPMARGDSAMAQAGPCARPSSAPPTGRTGRSGQGPGGRAPAADRVRRGRRNELAGRLAEEAVERLYRARGGTVLARRCRIGGGELDLVVAFGCTLVFVEVKCRCRPIIDSPVDRRQWKRLEAAASAFMVSGKAGTGAAWFARFDVALVDAAGAVTLYESAHAVEHE
ncbi:MAG: YraN family protein [Pseudomonadota bacterium]